MNQDRTTKSLLHEHQTLPSDLQSLDLFTEQGPPLAKTEGSVGGETGVKEIAAKDAPRSVPIEWFAKEQERLRKVGEESASAYWKKLGRKWP